MVHSRAPHRGVGLLLLSVAVAYAEADTPELSITTNAEASQAVYAGLLGAGRIRDVQIALTRGAFDTARFVRERMVRGATVVVSCAYGGTVTIRNSSGAPQRVDADYSDCATERANLRVRTNGRVVLNVSPRGDVSAVRFAPAPYTWIEALSLVDVADQSQRFVERAYRVEGQFPVYAPVVDAYSGRIDYVVDGMLTDTRDDRLADGSTQRTVFTAAAAGLVVSGDERSPADYRVGFAAGRVDYGFRVDGTSRLVSWSVDDLRVSYKSQAPNFGATIDGLLSVNYPTDDPPVCRSGAYRYQTREPLPVDGVGSEAALVLGQGLPAGRLAVKPNVTSSFDGEAGVISVGLRGLTPVDFGSGLNELAGPCGI